MAKAADRRLRLGAAEWVLLALFGGLSMWLLVTLAWRSRTTGLAWTGTDGPYLGDQMQYLGWVRDASDNLLIGNPFRLERTGEFFVHPGLAVSGVLNRLGLPPALAYLVWKPVAVVVLFLAVRTYVRRLIPDAVPRYVAMALALFAFAPMPRLAAFLDLGPKEGPFYYQPMALDMWPGLYLWGYPFTAIAVALIPITLLLYERARRGGRRGGQWTKVVAASGLLCSWLQPWQGATLIIIVVGAELLLWRGDRSGARPRLAAVTVAATSLPLVYYAALNRLDSAWELAGRANTGVNYRWWVLPAFLLPIILAIALDYRRPAPDFQHIALRIWPAAVAAVFLFIAYTPFGTFPLHSLQGLGIPVAVLAVRSVVSLAPSWKSPLVLVLLGALLVSCLGSPLVRELSTQADRAVHSRELVVFSEPYFLEDGERDALEFLKANSRRGGVLARVFLGQTVPGLTGRRTWVGIASWTPEFPMRVALADQLFAGDLDTPASQRLVRRTGARFLLSDCRGGADLSAVLGDLVLDVRRFGCAAVYQVR